MVKSWDECDTNVYTAGLVKAAVIVAEFKLNNPCTAL